MLLSSKSSIIKLSIAVTVPLTGWLKKRFICLDLHTLVDFLGVHKCAGLGLGWFWCSCKCQMRVSQVELEVKLDTN
jgi:hypothetical protein